jgi:hypothetical protein
MKFPFKILPWMILLACLHAGHCAVELPPDLDISSTKFWQNRVLYVAQVTSGSFTKSQFVGLNYPLSQTGELVCKITDVISGKPKGDSITIPGPGTLVWTDENQNIGIKKGDYILVIEPDQTGKLTVKLIPNPPKDSLIESLKQIAAINKVPSLSNLLDNAVSDYDPVSKFCLIQILNTPGNIKMPQGYPAKLQTVADDLKRESTVRVMAEELDLKSTGRESDSATEYSWLAKAIHEDTSEDWQQIRPFMERLLDLKDQRDAAVKLLCTLALDSKASMAVRIAAYNRMDDQRVFNFADPDQDSELIFSACLGMLNDNIPEIRGAGASTLQLITFYISPGKREAFVKRAEKQLQDAIQKETVSRAAFWMQNALQEIQGNNPGP